MTGLLRRHRWWLGRLAILPVHIFVFAIAVFFLVRAMPGDPVMTVLGGNTEYTQDDYDRIEATLGLDGSITSQLVSFLSNVMVLELGESTYTGRSVSSEIAQRLPATLELALLCLLAVIVTSSIAAYLAVFHPRGPWAVVIRVYSRLAGAVPQFVLAVAAIFVFYATLRWAPAPIGRVSIGLDMPDRVTGLPLLDSVLRGDWEVTRSMLAHLALPVAVMTVAQSDVLLKILIRSLDDQVDTPSTLFRVATGASRGSVLISVFRRAAPAAVTMAGTLFGHLLGGAIILESLFGFGGMGQYAIDAVNTKDVMALQGFLLASAVLSLLVFLIVDLTNMALDPRRRAGARVEESV